MCQILCFPEIITVISKIFLFYSYNAWLEGKYVYEEWDDKIKRDKKIKKTAPKPVTQADKKKILAEMANCKKLKAQNDAAAKIIRDNRENRMQALEINPRATREIKKRVKRSAKSQ